MLITISVIIVSHDPHKCNREDYYFNPFNSFGQIFHKPIAVQEFQGHKQWRRFIALFWKCIFGEQQAL